MPRTANISVKVDGIIDTWTPEKAAEYAERGYVHYHELIEVAGEHALHPDKVVWLKHTARTSFTLNGGPASGQNIEITPGVSYNFLPNGDEPYAPSP